MCNFLRTISHAEGGVQLERVGETKFAGMNGPDKDSCIVAILLE